MAIRNFDEVENEISFDHISGHKHIIYDNFPTACVTSVVQSER